MSFLPPFKFAPQKTSSLARVASLSSAHGHRRCRLSVQRNRAMFLRLHSAATPQEIVERSKAERIPRRPPSSLAKQPASRFFISPCWRFIADLCLGAPLPREVEIPCGGHIDKARFHAGAHIKLAPYAGKEPMEKITISVPTSEYIILEHLNNH